MLTADITLGLYIHIPWCIKKCPYCDFNSHALNGEPPETAYIKSLLLDLKQDIIRFNEQRPVQHIFIGGGTPSLFSPDTLHQLLTGIQQQLDFAADIEITLEANPGTFESDKFADFRQIGINRLSIGIQSFDDACLKRLGRVHNAQEALCAVEIAHHAGFDNFNLDLMFGLPEAKPNTSLHDINTAISLNPKHISFYQLTLEPNTYFHKYPPQLPAHDDIVNEQLLCQQQLQGQAYKQYEISAYAQAGYQCRHNLNYWRFGDYLGIGAGAHGKISRALPEQIMRYSKFKSPEQYIQAINKNQTNGYAAAIKPDELALEFVMNHLRLRQGFNLNTYYQRTGLQAHTLQPMLADCITQGLILHHQDDYYCSEKGWQFLDSILEQFV